MKTSKKLFISCFTLVLAFIVFAPNAHAATLSQTSVSLSQGQTSTVYAYNVSSSLYVSSNSNSSVATITISGNNINIYGNISGNTTATICEYGNYSCNTLYITVSGSGSSTLSLSQTSLSLTVGQTSNITAYNNYGTLYVSSNSNSNVATAYASGNSISIYGNTNGTTTIVICQSNYTNSCGTVYVTVSGYGSTTNNLGVNISNLTLPLGSSATLSTSNLSNYNYPYSNSGLSVSSNSNPNVASTSYSSVAVGCTNNAQYSIITGQPCYGYNYVGNNSSIIISAISIGSTTITLCQNGVNTCSTVYVTVTNNYSNYNYPVPVPVVPSVLGSQTCYFATILKYGMTGSNVYCLQSLLLERGYLNQNDITSTFDWNTQNAVINFQRDNYLYADGIVGRNTRSRLLQY